MKIITGYTTSYIDPKLKVYPNIEDRQAWHPDIPSLLWLTPHGLSKKPQQVTIIYHDLEGDNKLLKGPI